MKNRVAVLHGVNLDALERRPAQHYGDADLHPARAADRRASRASWSCETSFFQTNHEGEFVEELHKALRLRRRPDPQPGRLDALRVVDPRRAGDLRPAGGRGAPLRRGRARGVAARLGARGRPLRQGLRQGRRRLPRRARAARRSRSREPRRPDRAGACEELDALLVTEPANLRYLTGFTGSNGFAVVGPDVRRFVTDFRYVEQARLEVPLGVRSRAGAGGAARRVDRASGRPALSGSASTTRACRVRAHRRLRELLPPVVELVPAAGVVEDVRAVKEPEEVVRIAAPPPGRRHLHVAAVVRAHRPHGARRSRSRSSTRCACAARPGRASTRSSPRPSTGRCRTRSRATCRSRATRS